MSELPDKINKLLEKYENNPDVQLAITQSYFIGKNQKEDTSPNQQPEIKL